MFHKKLDRSIGKVDKLSVKDREKIIEENRYKEMEKLASSYKKQRQDIQDLNEEVADPTQLTVRLGIFMSKSRVKRRSKEGDSFISSNIRPI